MVRPIITREELEAAAGHSASIGGLDESAYIGKTRKEVLEMEKRHDERLKKEQNKSTTKKDIKKTLESVKETTVKKRVPTKGISKAIKHLEDIIKSPNFKYTKHETADKLIDTIFDVATSKKLKNKITNHESPDALIKAVHNSLPNQESTPKVSTIIINRIDRLAKSITENPEYNNINKQKIENYNFDTVYNFNNKYPKLMLKLFKTKEKIETLLKKKSDNIQKKKLSEEKAVIKKKATSEKGKTERLQKRIQKYKHFDDMSDEEVKRFNQARAYYMRKSKTSTILPKNLNKEDPEGLTNVCKALAEKGFKTMSEALFMEEYEG